MEAFITTDAGSNGNICYYRSNISKLEHKAWKLEAKSQLGGYSLEQCSALILSIMTTGVVVSHT